jgi:hypothetical protein
VCEGGYVCMCEECVCVREGMCVCVREGMCVCVCVCVPIIVRVREIERKCVDTCL